MRRALALMSSVTLTLGIVIGVAPAVSAAALGTVSVDYDGSTWSISPSTLSGVAGDTFVLINQRNSANNVADTFVSLQNDTAFVSSGGSSCTGTGTCAVLDKTSTPRNSATFTVDSVGVLKVMRSLSGVVTQIGTLTISASGSGSISPADLALVYPTATINGNGGTCTGRSQWTRLPGQGAWEAAAGMHLIECTRTGYTFMGWALSPTATTIEFSPGSAVPVGDESFTLYAMWRPVGVEIRYNANVGNADQCLLGSSNVVGDARQSAPVVLSVGGAVATAAPCTPIDARLVGWSLTGDGPSVVAAGAALPSSFAQGSSHVLYAKWQVVYGLTSSAEAVSVSQGESASVTFTATVNGAPAPERSVAVVGVGALIGTSGTTPAPIVTATTNGAGQVTLTVRLTGTVAQVRASFGNVSMVVPVAVAESRSITIVGDRTTVSGKPGIRVEGVATGFAAGTRVVPLIRFPGQTGFTEGSARPEIGADGSFFWERKTGKKTYVYFTTEDGSVKSNAVIIPAN